MGFDLTIGDPLEGGYSILFRCLWVFDFTDDDWGGFAAGEFLLRDDGVLFIRTGTSSSSGDHYSYKLGLWGLDARWNGGRDLRACPTWMRSHGYGLFEPTPVPVDATNAGPFLGNPPMAQPLRLMD